MKAANVLGILLALAATAGTALWVGRATATGAPQQAPLTYAGTLTDQDGKPYPTAQEVVVKFWDTASGGTQKCAATPVQAEAGTGNFQVTLPAECVQAVRDQSELWTELTVGPQKVVLPRSKVAAVPYALEADSAKIAGSAAAASGGLKTQVEGLVSDVAGLKAGGGGGGPWLVDANGVKLGRPSPSSPGAAFVITPKGYALQLAMGVAKSQILQSYGSILYSGPNCTGDAFLTSQAWGYGVPGVWLYYNSSANIYHSAKLSPAGAWSPSQVPYSSYALLVDGTCVQVTPGPATEAYALTPHTPAEVGLPDKIVGPLTYVP